MNKISFKKVIMLAVIVGTIALSSFIILPNLIDPNKAENAMLIKYELDGLSVKEIVNKLDSITDEKVGLNASITGTELVLYDNDKKYNFQLPSDEFYVSFAPYINNTHPCQTHNLVSCRGELSNKEFDVSIVKLDGTVITNQKVKSMDSGFIGIWLPRDIDANLSITYNDLTVTSLISTYAMSDTCITTPLKVS